MAEAQGLLLGAFVSYGLIDYSIQALLPTFLLRFRSQCTRCPTSDFTLFRVNRKTIWPLGFKGFVTNLQPISSTDDILLNKNYAVVLPQPHNHRRKWGNRRGVRLVDPKLSMVQDLLPLATVC